jgi:cell division septation protein DedD
VGAFRSEENAQVFMKKLQGKGYDAFIQQGSTKDKVPIYRVLIGKHEDRKAAEELAREIESKEQIKTTLFSE